MAKKKTSSDLDDMFDDPDEERYVRPTGLKLFDPVIGGGIPEGVVVEAYGPPMSGKTSIGYGYLAQLQEEGEGLGVLFDLEGSWNPGMGARLGIDTRRENKDGKKSFRLVQKAEYKVVEALFAAIKRLLYERPEVRVIMVDSLAVLVTQKLTELKEGEQSNTFAMDRARIISYYLNELDRWVRETGNRCTVYIVNHEKEVLSFGGFGPPKTDTAGGKSVKFLSSMRLEFRIVKTEKVEVYDPVTKQTTKKVSRLYIRVQATKNRFAPPFVPSTFIFELGKGIDRESSALAHAYGQKLIENSKGRITIPGEWSHTGEEVKLHGSDKAALYYREHTEAFEKLETHVASNLADSDEIVTTLDVDGDDETAILDLADLA